MSGPALQLRGLSVSYGGVKALSNVDLEVNDSELVGLIGPNGAGKTTLIDAVTGVTRSSGQITLKGRDIARVAAYRRARSGLARTWQSGALYSDLTVRENIAVASGHPSHRQTARQLLLGTRLDADQADRASDVMGVQDLSGSYPDEITQGQRKLVGVARALATSPRVLLLDEPAAGLDVGESQALGRKLHDIARSGTATLLIDHDMELVLGFCDRVIVMDFGQVIADGPPSAVRSDDRVIAAYLGGAAVEPAPTKAKKASPRTPKQRAARKAGNP